MPVAHAPRSTRVLVPGPRREDRSTLLPHPPPVAVPRPAPPDARREVRPAVVVALTALAVQAAVVLLALLLLAVLQPGRLPSPGPVPSPRPQAAPVAPVAVAPALPVAPVPPVAP